MNFNQNSIITPTFVYNDTPKSFVNAGQTALATSNP